MANSVLVIWPWDIGEQPIEERKTLISIVWWPIIMTYGVCALVSCLCLAPLTEETWSTVHNVADIINETTNAIVVLQSSVSVFAVGYILSRKIKIPATEQSISAFTRSYSENQANGKNMVNTYACHALLAWILALIPHSYLLEKHFAGTELLFELKQQGFCNADDCSKLKTLKPHEWCPGVLDLMQENIDEVYEKNLFKNGASDLKWNIKEVNILKCSLQNIVSSIDATPPIFVSFAKMITVVCGLLSILSQLHHFPKNACPNADMNYFFLVFLPKPMVVLFVVNFCLLYACKTLSNPFGRYKDNCDVIGLLMKEIKRAEYIVNRYKSSHTV